MSEPSNWPLSNEALRVRVPNHIISVLSDSVLSKDIFPTAIGYYPNAESHQMKRVEHDDFILIFCVDGKGVLETETYSGEVLRGDLFILPPGTPHQYKADQVQPWTLFWCHFRGALAPAFFEYIKPEDTCLAIRNLNDLKLLSQFNELITSVRACYSFEGFVHVASQLRHIITLVERIKQSKQKEKIGIILPDIHQYMRANLHKGLSLDELASFSHLSKYHFSRKYLEMTGYSPQQHFIHFKIEHACLLLEQVDISISDVAFSLGYDDALYFSRVFRKVMHLSPSQYRKSLLDELQGSKIRA